MKKNPDVNSLVKKWIITLELLRLILKYQVLMIELMKIKQNKSIKNELIGLIKNILSILRGNIAFDGEDGCQAYLIFQPLHRYVKVIANFK